MSQVSKPLLPVPPRWPRTMSEKHKRIFKRNRAAMNLLRRFRYANATEDW